MDASKYQSKKKTPKVKLTQSYTLCYDTVSNLHFLDHAVYVVVGIGRQYHEHVLQVWVLQHYLLCNVQEI